MAANLRVTFSPPMGDTLVENAAYEAERDLMK
jgi:hypothetical protein